jgi:hypothetical protein
MIGQAVGSRTSGTRPATALLVGAASLALMLGGCTFGAGENSKLPDDATRVLQSVMVSMSPAGGITALHSTAVATTSGSSGTVKVEQAFSPATDAEGLPFRVLTAYRSAEGAGTNLADLAGRKGRVEIDVTVENLTVKPTEITYDVEGSSRTQSALVGAADRRRVGATAGHSLQCGGNSRR